MDPRKGRRKEVGAGARANLRPVMDWRRSGHCAPFGERSESKREPSSSMSRGLEAGCSRELVEILSDLYRRIARNRFALKAIDRCAAGARAQRRHHPARRRADPGRRAAARDGLRSLPRAGGSAHLEHRDFPRHHGGPRRPATLTRHPHGAAPASSLSAPLHDPLSHLDPRRAELSGPWPAMAL